MGVGIINLSKPTSLILFLVIAGIGLTIGAASAVMVFTENLEVDNGAGDSSVKVTSMTGDSKVIVEDQGLRSWSISTKDGKKKFQIVDETTSKPRFTIKANGLVGIGVTNPSEKLDVNGNIKSVGSITADNYFDNGNTQTGTDASALGGSGNIASGTSSTVGGGDSNTASGLGSTIGGGDLNTASGIESTVGGGRSNTAIGDHSTVGGGGGFGQGNTASGDVSTVGGGAGNTASVAASTVGGGNNNIASGVDSTVGGGFTNTASKFASTVGGGNNNIAGGFAATVPGGELNEASGDYSFAAGRRAHATLNGAFVWADSTNADFTSTVPDQFSIRAAGGVRIVGDVSANNFEYSSPQTRSVVIFPVEFASTFDVDWLVPAKGAAGVIKSSSTKNFLFASIPQLPDGATITRLDCRVFDNSIAFEVGCDLLRKSFASDVGEFMAQTATSGASASNQDISDTIIVNPVVDRDTFGYVVRYVVGDNVCDESCKLFSAKVTYTIDRVE